MASVEVEIVPFSSQSMVFFVRKETNEAFSSSDGKVQLQIRENIV